MRVVVTGDNGEQTSVPSTTVGPIDAAPPVSVVASRPISGTAGAGHTLTAGDGTWSGTARSTSLPVAALRRRWRQLRRHRRRHRQHLRPHRHRRRPRDPRRGHRHQRRGRRHAPSPRRPPPSLPAPPVNTTQPPAPTGTAHRRRHADRRPRHVDRRRPDHLHVPVAALRRRRHDCADIAGATDEPTRRPAPTSATRSWSSSPPRTPAARRPASAPSTPGAAAPPANATPPSVSGDPSDGGTLTVDPGTWTGTPPDLEYQWQRCDADGTDCVDISGATTTPTRSAPTTSATRSPSWSPPPTTAASRARPHRAATPAVGPRRAHDTAAPAITGTVELGQTLTADTAPGAAPRRSTSPTSGSAATPTAPTASTSPAPTTTRTRWATTTRATPSWSS